MSSATETEQTKKAISNRACVGQRKARLANCRSGWTVTQQCEAERERESVLCRRNLGFEAKVLGIECVGWEDWVMAG